MEAQHFEFGPFALDASRGVLTRDRVVVEIGHRAIGLLQALLRAEGRVVTKAELMDAAWPGLVVEESNLSVQVAALRKALGTHPDGRPWIATIARVGYRFEAPVSAARPAPAPERAPGPAAQGHKPSIVVLPLVNMGARPEQEYLVDGLSDIKSANVGDALAPLKRRNAHWAAALASALAGEARPLQALVQPDG